MDGIRKKTSSTPGVTTTQPAPKNKKTQTPKPVERASTQPAGWKTPDHIVAAPLYSQGYEHDLDHFKANTPKGKHDLPTSFAMAKHSNLSYYDEAVVKRALKDSGFPDTKFLSARVRFHGDTQAYITSNKDVGIISFRGTLQLADFWSDLRAINPTPVKLKTGANEGEVHRGFQQALDRVWPEILKEAKRLQKEDPNRPIHLTGHSLGAALATIAALRLEAEGIKVHAVHTFGSPRVGDDNFARAYEKQLGAQTFRHVNYSDIVARVPSAARYVAKDAARHLGMTVDWGYEHVGKLLYFDEHGHRVKNPTTWQMAEDWFDSLMTSFTDSPGQTIRHHMMDGYLCVLDDLLKKGTRSFD
jgi:triacylglycerol lipase